MQSYNALIIGAGLSGLTAGSLLAKRGLRVAVVDKAIHPGGACGAFKRGGAVFDQGAAMLFGFGKKGFNPHRFVFNALEEPIDVIRHDSMYTMEFAGRRVEFYPDIERFTEELADVFPEERQSIKRFYGDLLALYRDVIVGMPFTTPDEMDITSMLPQIKKHPRSYLKFLRFMNMSVYSLLKRYFKNPDIFKFFDKLTSTYCYTSTRETPAVLGAVMFVDNHVGGTYYPAGSSLFLPGKLEKVIEENGGDVMMRSEAVSIAFEGGRPVGAALRDGRQIRADNIIYSGNVWALYGDLLPQPQVTPKQAKWAKGLVPTNPSAVVYLEVDAGVIPTGTLPVEMFAENPDRLDENEITAYIMSIDDHTLCTQNHHTVVAIGPCFETCEGLDGEAYHKLKASIQKRTLNVLERRFPGIRQAVYHAEVATPKTITQYAGKFRGAVAGPKQSMGQHMLKRQHTRTRWDNLFCCGESTVMGTGTPAVTISGISAANAVLEKAGLDFYAWHPDMKEYVRELPPGYTKEQLMGSHDEADIRLVEMASKCQFCVSPACNKNCPSLDIPGIMRRIYMGNFTGAQKLADAGGELLPQIRCPKEDGVPINDVMKRLSNMSCLIFER